MDENSVAAARLRTAIELAGATLLMTREHFRREHPAASEEELSALVNGGSRSSIGTSSLILSSGFAHQHAPYESL